VVFHDLGEYPAGGKSKELVDDPDAFLAKTYGKKERLKSTSMTGQFRLHDQF